jgi:hypothetical protein
MMGFTKLDEGILRSSIMAESPETFKVWIAFLASCGPDGVARISAIFIESICRLSPDVVAKAIATLEAPDPKSRSDKEEGRRILPVDGGWFVVNYEKYRSFNYSEKPEAVRKRDYRERKKKGTVRDKRDNVPFSTGHSASASASASSSGGGTGEEWKTDAGFIDRLFDEFWKAYPAEGRLAKKESRIKFGALVKRGELAEFKKGFRGYMKSLEYQEKERHFKQTPMYAKTFINGRWREYLGFDYKPKL